MRVFWGSGWRKRNLKKKKEKIRLKRRNGTSGWLFGKFFTGSLGVLALGL
jgi:hypothetical protein